MEAIFRSECGVDPGKDEGITVKVAFFEILNERVYDLLNANNFKVPLKLKEVGNGTTGTTYYE